MPKLRLFSLTPTAKVFPDEPVRESELCSYFEGFQNETISFQIAFQGITELDRRPVCRDRFPAERMDPHSHGADRPGEACDAAECRR
ncbi:MAG: hypothetical protein ACLUE8_16100 [Lachnospiraceae bacterium]